MTKKLHTRKATPVEAAPLEAAILPLLHALAHPDTLMVHALTQVTPTKLKILLRIKLNLLYIY